MENKDSTQAHVSYIIDHFHTPLRIQIPQIITLFKKELSSSPDPNLTKCFQLFSAFANQIDFHLLQEESIVFPLLLSVEKDQTNANLQEITPMVEAMESDHQEDFVFIRELKKLTNTFEPPSTASENLKSLYEALALLANQLEAHIEIENNVVFKKYKLRYEL